MAKKPDPKVNIAKVIAVLMKVMEDETQNPHSRLQAADMLLRIL